MTALSDDDRRILEQLRHAAAERAAIPPEEQIPVENPERYAFLIGMDEGGNPFPPRSSAGEESEG